MQNKLTGVPDDRRDAELEALIARIAGGDRAALADFYRATRSAVYAYSLSVLRQKSDAEDVLQDAYIRVWQHAGRYRPEGRPMAWLIVTVRNLALDRLRRSRNVVSFPESREKEAAAPPLSAEDRLTLEALLLKLDDRERQVVVLHAVTGLLHREIAEIMGLPLSTVLSKYQRAIKKLRIAWKEDT